MMLKNPWREKDLQRKFFPILVEEETTFQKIQTLFIRRVERMVKDNNMNSRQRHLLDGTNYKKQLGQ